jgi:glycosyltransferase involved in cell wall biosynthesis
MTSVIHVMMNPRTGPWSVMKRLAAAQRLTGSYSEVALGIITAPDWPQAYEAELPKLGQVYRARSPQLSGTLQHLCQMVSRPGIEAWVDDLARRSAAERVVVHFHNAWTSGAFLPLRGARTPITTVVTYHGIAGAEPLRRQPLRRWIHRHFAQRAAAPDVHLTSVDAGCFGAAEELFGIPADRFTVIPNGMPRSANDYGPFCNGSDHLTLAHVGALTPDKGWRIAADAVIQLSAQGTKVKFLIAGTGPDEDAARRLAAEHPQCIEFLGHVADPCRDLLPSVDVFVLMTSNDGLPMAIIEAMSCGIPVIATRIGGIPDTVMDGETGFLIDRTSQALVDAIGKILAEREILTRLSRNTLRRFDACFNISSIVEAYDQVYHQRDRASA